MWAEVEEVFLKHKYGRLHDLSSHCIGLLATHLYHSMVLCILLSAYANMHLHHRYSASSLRILLYHVAVNMDTPFRDFKQIPSRPAVVNFPLMLAPSRGTTTTISSDRRSKVYSTESVWR
jgi:hypothetical protein